MKKIDVAKSEVQSLVAEYRASAVAQSVATESGDHRKANRHHDVIADIYRELRRRGRDAQAALLPLLDDIDPRVRAWAAAHALEFAPDRGQPVLNRLRSAGGVVGLNAEMTLEEWSRGSLRFP